VSSYPIAVAKERLSQLIDAALAGESVTITRDGQPVAELRAMAIKPKGRPSTALIDEIAVRAKLRSQLGRSAADVVREMRDEEP
jgi:antitoxin (DNA-binding transcriptional repressor) of toxin-antitoxin stability system